MSAPPDLFVTEELFRRKTLPPNLVGEKMAIQELAAHMASDPDAFLPRFVDLAMRLTGGISAGLSLYEPLPSPGVFRWRYLQGSLATFENALTPRDFSPCGVTLDRRQPVLSRHPERYYTWISDANIVVPEVMLVPLYIGTDEPVGTLWIVSDSEEGHFNEEHARIAMELASFVGIALKMLRTEERLQLALQEQEMLTKEMSHRVKNLFAVSQAIVRLSARSSDSKEELIESLNNRFNALAAAQGIIRGSSSDERSVDEISTLAELLQLVFMPHETTSSSGRKRFNISGPLVRCGEHALNAVALVFNELATNAMKHGSIASDEGCVDLDWTRDGECVTFNWREIGGRKLEGPPASAGFGEKLLLDTVERQLTGSLRRTWSPEGLHVQLSIPVARLAN
jgi:two-component sensor histidine kinase